MINGKGKFILRNTCSADSLLTSLACAAADSSNTNIKYSKCEEKYVKERAYNY